MRMHGFVSLLLCLAVLCGTATAITPNVTFTADAPFGLPSLTVQFTDTSGLGGAATAWSWSFGDGSAPVAVQNPSHTYTQPGVYDVSLTVTVGGLPITKTVQGFVHVANPQDAETGTVNLTNAVVLTRPGTLPKVERKAPDILVEEIAKRTGVTWSRPSVWPTTGTVIALTAQNGTGMAADGYRLFAERPESGPVVIWVVGADARGLLYGVGKLLRTLDWAAGSVVLDNAPDVTSAPAYALRGCQMSYTNTNNTCDSWDAGQYEQQIRDLVVFGANAVENAPLDDTPSPHFGLTQMQMNRSLSTLCDDYGLEYWVWTAESNSNVLIDPLLREQELAKYETLFQNSTRLDAVFVPGGDPGSYHPSVLLPFLHDLYNLLQSYFPGAGVWVSIQGYEQDRQDYFFDYLNTNQPTWLKGVVFGPWTWTTLEDMRSRTPSQYPIRFYPDITHNVRCQYPVPDWDQALAHTLNREASNPRPSQEAAIHNRYAPLTCGFIAYSEGSHDDVNKCVWLMRGWDDEIGVNAILDDYTRYFFGPSVVEEARAGILGLEQDWVGPLATNVGVDATFDLWRQLASSHPALADNWRWQHCVLRACCDKYVKERLVHETALEEEANQILANVAASGAENAMSSAETVLAEAETEPADAALHSDILDLCDSLWLTIGYQSSTTAPYLASGLERSCVQDFIDWPVNNRYWLRKEFADIRNLGTETARRNALLGLAAWEDPGPGGFYDDLGNATKQPHLVRQLSWADDPGYVDSTQSEFSWHGGVTTNDKQGAGRLSWQDQAQTLYGQPLQMRYTGLAPDAAYTVRATYLGRFNGVATLSADGTVLGSSGTPSAAPYQVAYAIPRSTTQDGVLDLQWDRVSGRGCQIAEVWLTTPDSDKDGLPDYWESRYGLNPAVSTGNQGGAGDLDSDGLTNAREFELGTFPQLADSDSDALDDAAEVNIHHTDPLVADTDGGGVKDGAEVGNGSNPLLASDDWYGDVDHDTHINAVDVQLVVNAVLGFPVPPGNNPDLNNDAKLNAIDVQTIVNRLLGLF